MSASVFIRISAGRLLQMLEKGPQSVNAGRGDIPVTSGEKIFFTCNLTDLKKDVPNGGFGVGKACF